MIKTIVFPLLKHLLWMKRRTVGYAILTYHNISDGSNSNLSDPMTVDYASFKQQMNYVSNELDVISIPEIVERINSKSKVDKLYVGITFDDGFLSQYKLATPLLENLSLPATFFITTNFANQTEIPQLEKWKYWIKYSNQKIRFEYNDINEKFNLKKQSDKDQLYSSIMDIIGFGVNGNPELNSYLKRYYSDYNIPRIYMNWEEIGLLNNNPLFTIGSHSKTHRNFISVKNILNDEIFPSKSIIEQNINKEVNIFAYPFGTARDLNNDIIQTMNLSGYKAAFTAIGGLNNNINSPYELNRIAPLRSETIDQIRTKIYWAEEIKKIKFIVYS